MLFCQYKNLLGVPGEGIHFHVCGIAIVDVLMTIIGAYIISYGFETNFTHTLLILFLLGMILHLIFCVETTVNKIFTNLTSGFYFQNYPESLRDAFPEHR